MVLKLHSNLLRDLSSMLMNANDHYAIIQVGGDQNMKEFRAHSNCKGCSHMNQKESLPKTQYYKVLLAQNPDILASAA